MPDRGPRHIICLRGERHAESGDGQVGRVAFSLISGIGIDPEMDAVRIFAWAFPIFAPNDSIVEIAGVSSGCLVSQQRLLRDPMLAPTLLPAIRLFNQSFEGVVGSLDFLEQVRVD